MTGVQTCALPIFYLQAKPEVLRARIAKKKAHEEKQIAPEYVEEVARAYEHFFFRYAGADLLVPLQEEVWSRSRRLLGREVPLVEQQVADKSGIVGAAGLVMAPRV